MEWHAGYDPGVFGFLKGGRACAGKEKEEYQQGQGPPEFQAFITPR
jgi:hypothetical protein